MRTRRKAGGVSIIRDARDKTRSAARYPRRGRVLTQITLFFQRRFGPVLLAAMLLVVGIGVGARAEEGRDLTFYLDRAAYLVALQEAETRLAFVANNVPSAEKKEKDQDQVLRAHIRKAIRKIRDSRKVFEEGRMVKSL
ncbi:MAG: hypothetical protein D6679_05320, partial [Candidatus Hydrogenedentota bacterium]